MNFQTRGGTFRGTLYKAISTLLLPKRPLSKCSFYRLITLTGTMQCGDTQTSLEVFIFNFSAPTQAQRRLSLAAALLIYLFPIIAYVYIGKQQTAKFYHKTGYEFVRFFGSIFVTSAGNFPVKMYVVCGHLCPKMCCKYDYQSSVAPELVPEIIFDQFVHLSGGTF